MLCVLCTCCSKVHQSYMDLPWNLGYFSLIPWLMQWTFPISTTISKNIHVIYVLMLATKSPRSSSKLGISKL